MYKIYIKRLVDVLFALIVLIVFFPVILILAILLSFSNKGPSFFIQERPGKNERLFKLIKFKTMNDQCDERGNLLPDDKRLTKLGWIVRKSSLDELPQLFNVLKGDMSLIGPRPLLVEYLPLYNSFQKRRHDVRPGITGWAQVNGRNAISWDKKFSYDVWYVENVSFFLDLKIMLLTLKKVFKKEGISQAGYVGMEKFKGN
ncbi:MAG TPA: sugar transferase [Tenuifilaceae bacterium]|nr:sugar transferase [Tenuifilaceae bacterium]